MLVLMKMMVCLPARIQVFRLANDRNNSARYEREAGLWAGLFPVIGIGSFFVLLFQVR